MDAPEPQPASCFLGTWTKLLSPPANAQAPLGTACWLMTGWSGQSLAPQLCQLWVLFLLEPGMQPPSLRPSGTSRGKERWGAAPMSPQLGASLKPFQL